MVVPRYRLQGTVYDPPKLPYGTTAWEKSCGRRNQVENLNGILRNKGGLEDKWCRALGDEARFVGSVMMGVAYLLRETKLAWHNTNNGDPGPEVPDDHNEAEPGDVDNEPPLTASSSQAAPPQGTDSGANVQRGEPVQPGSGT